MSMLPKNSLLTQGQAPPREKLFAKSNGLADQNMTAKRRQGSNLQFEAMLSTSIPSLFDMCIKLLQNNIDDLPTLENIDDEIVIRILNNCEPHKLEEIERKNEEENVILQTDELWKRLVTKDFGAGLLSKISEYMDETRPYKALYNELNRERMEREYKIQKIKEDSKRMKQSSTRMVGAKTVGTSQTLNTSSSNAASQAKHVAKTIDPIRQPTRIRNSSTRSSSSSSNSDRSRTTSSAPNSSKKSKLWTSSLGGESSTVRKKPEQTKSSVFTPGNVSAVRNPPMTMNRYIPPPSLSISAPLVYRQPVVVSKANTIDYTKKRPSSPPQSDTIAGSPVVSQSYVENVFGKETSKRFEKVKRQSTNNSAKLRDSTRAPQSMQPPNYGNSSRGLNPKSVHPPPSSHSSSSLAPPQKKSKPNNPSHYTPPPSRAAQPPPSSSRSSELNFTIPKRK